MKRFKTKGKVVTDTKTGLQWQKEPTGQMTWQKAMDYAASLKAGWRLPTIEELITLIDFAKVGPASDFPDMPCEWFWSSSSRAAYTSNAWDVSFYNGLVDTNAKSSSIYARCVRSGTVS
jgi:hypothetical protein